MEWLDSVRYECGFAFYITSGYRCPEHPLEARKDTAGAHSTGKAVDISVRGRKALRVIEVAQKQGCTRIGINQKGSARFIHLDRAEETMTSPAIWTY